MHIFKSTKSLFCCLFLLGIALQSEAQVAPVSVARQWNEALIQSIREDFARPPVHARNLHHMGLAMYDAWAAYDSLAEPFLLGKKVGNYTCNFDGIPKPADVEAARREAISFACFRLMYNRFSTSPNAAQMYSRIIGLMLTLGYDWTYTGTDYQSGNPAALGNYIGMSIVQMGWQDGSNEFGNYGALNYMPVNLPLNMEFSGAPNVVDINRWQPLQLSNAIDQNGNPIPAIQVFQSPEWGRVQPFALDSADRKSYFRNGFEYVVYHDPGAFPTLDTIEGGGLSEEFKWNYELVLSWSAQLDTKDSVIWDISPRSIGNTQFLPNSLAEYRTFYKFAEGGDSGGIGHALNPKTGQPYAPQLVPRGDYTRVLAQFWADGPTSETPPGHWFSILNKVMDHPDFVRRFNGQGPVLEPLEWDVKAYFTLGGAMHDAAISAWGVKGWYDGPRPVTALRYMAGKGQCSDLLQPAFHPAGVHLIPGLIELVKAGDPLAGTNGEHINKIKFYTWKGPETILNPVMQTVETGWILAENWWPYQRKTFVTPPFAGYVSGHSTYSRAAAEVLTLVTGDEFFPGGMGEFHITANNNFLVLEQGPTVDVTLQWATYRDASDQTSLSRIWGGIHPPFDDIPGRKIGMEVGHEAYALAKSLFFPDRDGDGFAGNEECDDQNANVYPNAPEFCDGIDNNCDGIVDELPTFTYYYDADGDGFGDFNLITITCLTEAPQGYATNALDCDDNNPDINPNKVEICDGIDNNCDGLSDNGLVVYAYFPDTDGDGYGDALGKLDTCSAIAPANYINNGLDCDDANAAVFPGAPELADNLDNDCNGLVDDFSSTQSIALQAGVFPNPTNGEITIFCDNVADLKICLSDLSGHVLSEKRLYFTGNQTRFDLKSYSAGVYLLKLTAPNGQQTVVRLIKQH